MTHTTVSLGDVSFTNSQSVSIHYKAFTNYMNYLSKLHSDKVFTRYYSNKTYKTLTYADVDRMAINLACKWSKDAERSSVVSFMSDHTINYVIVMLALMKLRRTMLAISPRNSEAAITNLLEKTESKLLIANAKYENIIKGVKAQNPDVKVIIIQPLDIEALSKEPLNSDYKKILNYHFSDEDIEKDALIIHSSGSTAFPKPIYLSNRYLFNMLKPFHLLVNEKENMPHVTENDCMFSLAPLFHIFGFFALFSMATVGGSAIFVEKLPPSQEEINYALEVNKATIMCAPPLILEQMIPYLKETNDFNTMQRLKYIIFGGAPLKHEAGEWLQSHNINVRDMYGTTEIGAFMSSDLDPKSKNWGSIGIYMKDKEGHPYGVFETNDESEPDVKHLYIRAGCPTLASHVANRPDGGYNTNDLFKEDPNFPGYYIYLGRRDDTLIMENGEKTNPVPMESTIRQSPVVKQVAIFGQNRQCTAALVETDLEYAIRLGPDEIIAAVHEAVKEANAECPSHSIILPQMVKILPFNKSLPSTDKGTVMRKKAEKMYKDIIDKLYKDFLEGPSRNDKDSINADTSSWSSEQTLDFLISCASEVLSVPKSSFKDHTRSIFDYGLNSLTAIQLRNKIAEYFDNIPQNFLFQHPSFESMHEALMNGIDQDLAELNEKRYQQAQNLALAYIKKAKADFFPIARHDDNKKRDKVVLLTGSTGTLGSFMLRDLLKDPSVKKVYCCVRGKEGELFNRLIKAFESRSLDISLLKSDRVETLPMRFNDPYLGFSEEKYNQLRNEVTIVQHCAWVLDFNMTIDYYDKECITPFYHLLKFAYREINPMHVHFISSISASAATGDQIVEEPLPLDSHVSMPMGYAHSKFVVEKLMNYLTAEKNFPCIIERLGQVCGDSENGVWNTSEQFPLMFIGGGSIMHKMPELDTIIDWITVDYASASIVDIMLRTADLPITEDNSIYHIVNPRLITWSDVLEAMRGSNMVFETVSPSEWVNTLAQDTTNPAARLLSFYEGNFKEAFKMPIWQTKKTSALTPIITKAPILDANLFSKFLARWQSVGFYNPSN
ncbi:uncharacterized protein BX663DRAFT_431462 [Cokeromyces recurvatus]|uniref:uncharacterized protein n=1 Tax=Cokeromyces recurvatus TaxID=90255 RepID=UPI002220DAE0|nr:uncharacterized protein BX663DRAFT_431462 [Cokeromyces recurvatus]KAI7904874.1 hypothetical protein BX663DRAFT_431462 [Cokeromyces recurvatus]